MSDCGSWTKDCTRSVSSLVTVGLMATDNMPHHLLALLDQPKICTLSPDWAYKSSYLFLHKPLLLTVSLSDQSCYWAELDNVVKAWSTKWTCELLVYQRLQCPCRALKESATSPRNCQWRSTLGTLVPATKAGDYRQEVGLLWPTLKCSWKGLQSVRAIPRLTVLPAWSPCNTGPWLEDAVHIHMGPWMFSCLCFIKPKKASPCLTFLHL